MRRVTLPWRNLLLATPIAGLAGVMACILTEVAYGWMFVCVAASGMAIAAYLLIERFRPRL